MQVCASTYVFQKIYLEMEEDATWKDCDVREAAEVLACRPGFHENSLVTTGGPKFFGRVNNQYEEDKVRFQLAKSQEVLSFRKVRKLCALGCAEWIPDIGLAKITKQGKFIQHMGHHDDSFVLYPEEALFLLDIGDIELLFKGVPLAFQEAFTFLLSSTPNLKRCTLDEYAVFSHLARQGYIVRRFPDKNEKHEVITQQESSKRKISDEPCECKLKLQKSDVVFSKEKEDDFMKTSRNWWLKNDFITFTENALSLENKGSMSYSENCSLKLPNLANRDLKIIPKPQRDLVPVNFQVDDFKVEDIWYQRIHRDANNYEENVIEYSYSKKIIYEDIAKKARNWMHYKKLLSEIKVKNEEKYIELLNKMRSGNVTPLLHPHDAISSEHISKKIKLSEQSSHEDYAECDMDRIVSEKYLIKYNVHKNDPNRPFKKTDPSIPFSRIVLCDVQEKIPDLGTMLELMDLSDGVPLKYAVVDSGQVSFYSFNEIDIPSYVSSKR